METYHLVLSTVGREPLFLETGPRRAALRAFVRVAGPAAWAFALADDHMHALVETPHPGRLGGHVALAFAALPAAPALQPAWSERVESREHLLRLVPYVLRQSEHHGLGPAAEWEGGCFLDLVGARRLVGFDTTRWRRGVPREDVRLVWDAVHLAKPPGVEVRGHSLDALVAAAARAVAADPTLQGKAAEVVRARRVAVALAREGGFTTELVARALAASGATVRRLGEAVDEHDLIAARRALAIDAALARRRVRAA